MKKIEYKVPDTCLCGAVSQYLIAVSATGEDFTDPEPYGGF